MRGSGSQRTSSGLSVSNADWHARMPANTDVLQATACTRCDDCSFETVVRRAGTFWLTSIGGVLAYQLTRPIPTSLAIIHARVYAQVLHSPACNIPVVKVRQGSYRRTPFASPCCADCLGRRSHWQLWQLPVLWMCTSTGTPQTRYGLATTLHVVCCQPDMCMHLQLQQGGLHAQAVCNPMQ